MSHHPETDDTAQLMEDERLTLVFAAATQADALLPAPAHADPAHRRGAT